MSILKVITYDEEGNSISNALPDPQTLQWDSVDMEAEGCSGTNQLGEYFRDVITSKTTLSVSWGLLSDAEIKELLECISKDSMILEYPDAGGGRVIKEVYVNSRTAPMYCYNKGGSGQADSWKWQGLSISFMEV